jgi:hypothetical protein
MKDVLEEFEEMEEIKRDLRKLIEKYGLEKVKIAFETVVKWG